MYRQYYTQAEWDDIVNDNSRKEHSFPHCNTDIFHEPGACPFCDNHYRRWPSIKPIKYTNVNWQTSEWGGNSAPILDEAKAVAEKTQWELAMRQMTKSEWEQEQEGWVKEKVKEIREVFVKKAQ